jgi:DNA-binding LacI/PurR family transcriptional regulator
VIGKLREQGLDVPGDIRLVSYGDTHLARYFTPRITSLSPHNAEMARRTGEMIRKRINNEPCDLCQYIIRPELVVRET